jgi:uncharacterized membrane protein YhaH (DUF805 family)
MNYIINCVIKKYAVFKGRASIKEYRYFGSLCHVLNIICLYLDSQYHNLTYNNFVLILIFLFYCSVSIIPYISLNIRRLHDINKSGWWFFGSTFIPFAGLLLSFIVLFFIKGTPGPNKYGEPPIN